MTTVEGWVTTQQIGHVGVLTLNRPQARNAVDAQMAVALSRELDRLELEPSVRAVVVTGSGSAFCAGADLKALGRGEQPFVPERPEWGFAGMTERRLVKPVLAAVNGPALGGGAEIVLSCDLAVMSDEAWLGFPEATRGVVAGGGGMIRLPRATTLKRALEKLLTGEPISPAEALSWGLVNRVAPAADVMEATLSLAHQVAASSPQSVRLTKWLAWRSSEAVSGVEAALWRDNAAVNDHVLTSHDAGEGLRAFAERRLPSWADEPAIDIRRPEGNTP